MDRLHPANSAHIDCVKALLKPCHLLRRIAHERGHNYTGCRVAPTSVRPSPRVKWTASVWQALGTSTVFSDVYTMTSAASDQRRSPSLCLADRYRSDVDAIRSYLFPRPPAVYRGVDGPNHCTIFLLFQIILVMVPEIDTNGTFVIHTYQNIGEITRNYSISYIPCEK